MNGSLPASSLAHFCESAGLMAMMQVSSWIGRPALPSDTLLPRPPSSSLMYLTAASMVAVYSGKLPFGSPCGFWRPMTIGLTLGLERLVDRALQVGGVLAGVLALVGVEAVVGLAGRADAALAAGGGRGGRAALPWSSPRRPWWRRRRWSWLRRRRGGGGRRPAGVVVVATRGRDECECTDEHEWLQRS